MPFLQDILAKVKGFFAALADFLKGAFAAMMDSLEVLAEKLPPPFNKRVVLIGLGAFLVILLLGIIIAVVEVNSGQGARSQARSGPEPVSSFQRVTIPAEELFLPEEPDFLPGVLLEREPRKAWTAADAEPHWQDPLKNGEEQWRDRIESEIDALLERVP